MKRAMREMARVEAALKFGPRVSGRGEARALERLREAFTADALGVGEFEAAVGRVLAGDLAVVDDLLGVELLFGPGIAIPVSDRP